MSDSNATPSGDREQPRVLWEIIPSAVESKSHALCRCVCGTVREVLRQHLKRGMSRSCGCIVRRRRDETNEKLRKQTNDTSGTPAAGQRTTLSICVGEIFGKLRIVEYSGSDDRRRWLCACVKCGYQSSQLGASLLDGSINGKCCPGCVGSIPDYVRKVWYQIKDRCLNPNCKAYANYGGRGITICDRWLNSIDDFYADIGPRPSPKHTLDRYPDNNAGYQPGNVRWASRTEQNRNRRDNVRVTYNGETRTLPEWSEIVGIPYGTLDSRRRLGWTVEDMLTKPVRFNKRWAKGSPPSGSASPPAPDQGA